VANGKMEWRPLEDGDITLGRVWGVLGVLHERTAKMDQLVTSDQCELHMAQCRERVQRAQDEAQDKRRGRLYSAALVFLSCLLTAILAVAGSVAVHSLVG